MSTYISEASYDEAKFQYAWDISASFESENILAIIISSERDKSPVSFYGERDYFRFGRTDIEMDWKHYRDQGKSWASLAPNGQALRHPSDSDYSDSDDSEEVSGLPFELSQQNAPLDLYIPIPNKHGFIAHIHINHDNDGYVRPHVEVTGWAKPKKDGPSSGADLADIFDGWRMAPIASERVNNYQVFRFNLVEPRTFTRGDDV